MKTTLKQSERNKAREKNGRYSEYGCCDICGGKMSCETFKGSTKQNDILIDEDIQEKKATSVCANCGDIYNYVSENENEFDANEFFHSLFAEFSGKVTLTVKGDSDVKITIANKKVKINGFAIDYELGTDIITFYIDKGGIAFTKTIWFNELAILMK